MLSTGCGGPKGPQAEQGYCLTEEEFIEVMVSLTKQSVSASMIDRLMKENARCRALEEVYL